LGSGSCTKNPTENPDLAASSPGVSSGQDSGTRRKTGVFSNLSSPNSDSSGGRRSKPILKRMNVKLASSDNANIFSWLAAVPSHSEAPKRQSRDRSIPDHTVDVNENIEAGQSFRVDRNKIEDTLTDMHSFLCTSQFKRNREYRKCPLSTVEEVEATVAQLLREERSPETEPGKKRRRRRRAKRSSRDDSDSGTEGSRASGDRARTWTITASDSKDPDRGSGRQRRTQMIKEFVKISKTLFQLFLPLDHKSEMVSKYWGAVNLLVQV